MQFSSSVPTTFVWDCLKEKCEEFPNAGNNTRDCHDVTVFLIEFDFGLMTLFSRNCTELFYINLD